MTTQTAARRPRPRPAATPSGGRSSRSASGVFILLLDITIVNVALADIQDELGATLSDLQWVIDAYALSLAALLLTAGSLADLYGRRLRLRHRHGAVHGRLDRLRGRAGHLVPASSRGPSRASAARRCSPPRWR